MRKWTVRFIRISFILLQGVLWIGLYGCTDKDLMRSDSVEKQSKINEIIQICQRNYSEVLDSDQRSISDLEVIRSIVSELGEHGYTAVDSENQIDMTESEPLLNFCEQAEKMQRGEITVTEVTWTDGCIIWNFETRDGKVDVRRTYYRYEDGKMKQLSSGIYRAVAWNYTKEGYLLFSGSWFSGETYELSMSGLEDANAFRVLPLDDIYRELGRKYLHGVGFERNNIFTTDWSEEDFGDLDFCDVFDLFYPKVYKKQIPYTASGDRSICSVYRIAKDEFEHVIMTYFHIDSETLQKKVTYHPEDETYEYKPRGYEETEYPEYPYSEVVGYEENKDGTITLTANVVFPYGGNSKVYVHEVRVRPLETGGVQYVSNHIQPSENNAEATWHTPRLTKEEWEEMYGK